MNYNKIFNDFLEIEERTYTGIAQAQSPLETILCVEQRNYLYDAYIMGSLEVATMSHEDFDTLKNLALLVIHFKHTGAVVHYVVKSLEIRTFMNTWLFANNVKMYVDDNEVWS